MPRPTIAVLTDFGLDDHYVGAMKGVIAGICPEANVIDITHGVPPQDVAAAAFTLAAAAPYLPSGTVCLVVVDPGVGTARRAVATRAGEHLFVGPDNGVFDLVHRRSPPSVAVEITPQPGWRQSVGRTFEGRDRFAPAAAALAAGQPIDALGPAVALQPRLRWPAALATAGGIEGEVVHVDRFGNLITCIERTDVEALLAGAEVLVGDDGLARVVGTYGEGSGGELVALLNSSDLLEIAVVAGHAAARLAVGRGARVRVRRRA